ncbi:MAG: TonB-dependent receptor [Sedimentisphaerales bacterium]|nr:TonB-dependent receptor [Sedimentisphaerales bacterium]
MNLSPKQRYAYLLIGVLMPTLPAIAALDTDDIANMDIEELLNVEISVASKKAEPLTEAPGIVSVIPTDEITLYGDRNLHQLLQRQASVYTRGSYMYPNNLASFRGDMPTHLDIHTLILLNGRPIRESGFGGVNFPVYMAFPMTALDSVELIRGPGSVLYGTNAFTGVVNLRSRRVPKETQVSVAALGGSYGYHDATVSLGGRSGALGYVTDVRVAGQDGYAYALTDGQGVFGSRHDENRNVSATTHLEYRGFTFDAFATDLEAFHLGPLPWWSLPYHEYGVRKLFANAGYRAPLGDRTTLELNLTYNLHENRFANTTQTVGLNSSDVLGEVTLFTNPIDHLNVTLGYLQECRTNYRPDDDYYQSIPAYRHRPRSAYAQADYKIGKSVKLIAGTQWNDSSQDYEDLVSRYGVIFTPLDKWGLKLLRGEAFRGPFALETDVYDIPILVGNKNLKPETITTYDAQLFYTDEKTRAAVTYFNSTIDQLIIRDTSVNPASFTNGGQQAFEGMEFEIKHSLTAHWQVLGSAMHQNNKQTSDLNPSTAPDYMVKVGTGYTWDWGTAALAYTHFGKPPRLASEVVVNPEPEALNLVSLNVRFDMAHWSGGPKGRSILTLRVENLLDEDIWVPDFNRGGNPNSLPDGPGMTAYAGLTLTF